MALQFEELKTSQTTAPPVYGQQGMVKTPVLAADQLTTQPKIDLPQPDYNPAATEGFINGLGQGQKSLTDYYNELAPKGEAVDMNNAVLRRIFEMAPDYAAKANEQITAEQNAGIPDLRRQIADINGQLQTGIAELTKSDIATQNRLAGFEVNPEATTGFVTRQQSETARQYQFQRAAKAAELGLIQARAQALQGSLESAQATVNRAIDLKYDAQEKEYNTWLKQAEIAERYMDKDEKRRLEAIRMKREDDQIALQEQKEKEKQVNNIMVEAARFGADSETLQRIQKSGSLGEAIKNSGEFLSTEFRQKLEQQKFENQLNLEQLSISRANLAVSRGNLALSQRKQALEEAVAAGLMDPSGQVSPEMVAYAQQYASTGKIPTGLPKGTFGIVAEAAKSLPKPDGTLVDINTGVRPDGMSAGQTDGVVALYDLTKKLKDAEDLFKTFKTGVIAGSWNKLFPSDEQTRYNTLRNEIVDLLSRARSGAALTETEIKEYQKKIPSRFVKGAWTGPSGTDLIKGLQSSIQGKLDTTLKANGAAIYGYSTVKVGDKNYKVGDIISNGEMQARVNPDGTLTLVQ